MSFPEGLGYDGEYTLDIPKTVLSRDGIGASKKKIRFFTELKPVNMTLDYDSNISGKTEADVKVTYDNLTPYAFTDKFMAIVYNEDGFVAGTKIFDVNVEANTKSFAPEKEIVDLSGISGGTTMSVLCISNYAADTHSGTDEKLELTGGLIDRSFDEDRTVYRVMLKDSEGIPDVHLEGAKLVKQAESTDSGKNITVLNKDNKEYRFVFKKKNALVQIGEILFDKTNPDKIIIPLKGSYTGDLQVIAINPKSKGDEESYDLAEVLTSSDTVKINNCFSVKNASEQTEYVFPKGSTSGRYTFCFVGENTDGISSGSVYYSSRADLDNALKEINDIIEKSAPDKIDSDIDAFINNEHKILKLDKITYMLHTTIKTER